MTKLLKKVLPSHGLHVFWLILLQVFVDMASHSGSIDKICRYFVFPPGNGWGPEVVSLPLLLGRTEWKGATPVTRKETNHLLIYCIKSSPLFINLKWTGMDWPFYLMFKCQKASFYIQLTLYKWPWFWSLCDNGVSDSCEKNCNLHMIYINIKWFVMKFAIQQTEEKINCGWRVYSYASSTGRMYWCFELKHQHATVGCSQGQC